MEVTVNIEDSKLTDLVSQGIDALSKETVAEMAKEAIRKALANGDTARSMLIRTSYGEARLQDWFEKAIVSQISPKDIEEFKDVIFDVVKKEGRDLVIGALADTLTRRLFTFDNQEAFRDRLVNEVRSMPPATY